MTDPERRLWIHKLGEVLHAVLVEIRSLTCQEGQAERVNDLTDLTHNIPLFMVGQDDHVLGYLRAGFVDYGRKHQPDDDPEQSRYVRLLDMDEATFNDLYRSRSWAWPDPAPAAAAG